LERIAASVGLLEEATTKFEKAEGISKGGVLFSIPALLSNGLLKHTKKHFSLPKGYYNLKHIFITLAFMTLLRIKSIDAMQYCSPGEIGKALGIDRVPEVKTIRKKLGILAEQNNAQVWNSELSEEWLATAGTIAGLLYVDGRVRVYHGKKTKLPKRYISREKLCLRGMSDYWVNDALGQPYFVVSSAHNKGLLQTLKAEIIPELLKEVPDQFSQKDFLQDAKLSRFSIIFDREGYSPEYFKELWKNYRISCYTYKKYPGKDWPTDIFKEEKVKLHNGEVVRMKLAEKGITLQKEVELREIRRLTENGHQTAIITTDFIPETAVIAANMFARWSQENFFKYMREHFGIDRLIEYGTTPVDETVKVVNPEYRNIDSRIRSISQKLGRKISEFGQITLELENAEIEKEEDEIKKYIKKKSQIQETIELYKDDLIKLKDRRKITDTHICISELPEAEKYSSLSTEKKHIMDTIKMIAYRAETAMATMIQPQLSKRKETKSLLRQIFSTEADICPDTKNNILTVSLHSLANEKSNRIVENLCQELNQTETIFPGTNLRLFYKLVTA
jgi:hypothetical protein